MIYLFLVRYGMFEIRVNKPEFLDAADCEPQLASGSYRFMRLVNRFAGGTGAVKNFLAREMSTCNRTQPIRVLDIGSGTCDIPLAITKWAQKQGRRIEFTCIDTNQTALRIAAQKIKKSSCDSIELKNVSFLEFESRQNFDYAIGSMFFHHLEDEQIPELIKKLRSYIRCGILINDLRRNSISYMICFFLVCLFPDRVRHDALLSIRKGFKPDELQQLLSRVENVHVNVEIVNFSRLAAIVEFNNGIG
jgi:2-polyprenyl-3-methyl-5-hydroxy-6-metoxy-1,4-benzoquinol methylase